MSRPQCPRCLRPTTHCLCALIPHLDSRTRVLLLQHPSEVNHALNTARLAALGLNNAQLLVVPDGTWRKARKLLHLNPLLAALPRVTLANGGVSRYRLRKAPGPGALSTLEAIVQALQVLEAPVSFEPLLKPFEALIEGQIAAMGEEVFWRNHCGGRQE